MPGGRASSLIIELTPNERKQLRYWQRCTTIPAGLARRARIVRLLADGETQTRTAELVGVERCVVRTWAKRFVAERIDGLYDRPGRGAKPSFSP